MKRQLLILLFLFAFAFCVSAQTEEPQKITEFEDTNCDDYRARMDLLLTATDKLADSKGYVYIYTGKVQTRIVNKKTGNTKEIKYVSPEAGRSKDIFGFYKKHLSFRNFPADKIVFVETGFREKFTIEFWNVPSGAEPPKPTPTLKKIKQLKRKHREFGFCGEI